jgi:hypothetical protein
MKSMAGSLVRLLLTISVVLCVVPVDGSGFAQRNEPDQEWVDVNYGTIVTALLPIKHINGEHIAYRFTHKFAGETLEYSFVINTTRDSANPLRATVRMADGVPIHKQMLTLRRQNPGAGLSQIQEKIKVKRWESGDAKCPAIRLQFEKFQELRFKAPRFSAVVLDGPDYELIAQTGAGRMTLFPGESDDPAVVWASETRDALARCGGGESAQ